MSETEIHKRNVKASPSLRKKHKRRVRQVFPEIIRSVYRNGFPVVEWAGPLNVEKLPAGQKWVSGAGQEPLLRNDLLGMAVMRKRDDKNPPLRSVVGCKLYLVWKGKITLCLDGKDYVLKKGDFIFAPPLCLQQVKKIQKGSIVLLFRAPDVGNTKMDKLDYQGNAVREIVNV